MNRDQWIDREYYKMLRQRKLEIMRQEEADIKRYQEEKRQEAEFEAKMYWDMQRIIKRYNL